MMPAAQLELFVRRSFITISFFTGEQVYVHHNFVVCILIEVLVVYVVAQPVKIFLPMYLSTCAKHKLERENERWWLFKS